MRNNYIFLDSFILDKEYVKEFKSGRPISPIVNSFIDFHSLGVILIDSLSGFKISCVQSRSILKLDIGEIDEKFKDFEKIFFTLSSAPDLTGVAL